MAGLLQSKSRSTRSKTIAKNSPSTNIALQKGKIKNITSPTATSKATSPSTTCSNPPQTSKTRPAHQELSFDDVSDSQLVEPRPMSRTPHTPTPEEASAERINEITQEIEDGKYDNETIKGVIESPLSYVRHEDSGDFISLGMNDLTRLWFQEMKRKGFSIRAAGDHYLVTESVMQKYFDNFKQRKFAETRNRVCIIFVDVVILYWIIRKGKRDLLERIEGDFLYLNHDEYYDFEIWKDSLCRER